MEINFRIGQHSKVRGPAQDAWVTEHLKPCGTANLFEMVGLHPIGGGGASNGHFFLHSMQNALMCCIHALCKTCVYNARVVVCHPPQLCFILQVKKPFMPLAAM